MGGCPDGGGSPLFPARPPKNLGSYNRLPQKWSSNPTPKTPGSNPYLVLRPNRPRGFHPGWANHRGASRTTWTSFLQDFTGMFNPVSFIWRPIFLHQQLCLPIRPLQLGIATHPCPPWTPWGSAVRWTALPSSSSRTRKCPPPCSGSCIASRPGWSTGASDLVHGSVDYVYVVGLNGNS